MEAFEKMEEYKGYLDGIDPSLCEAYTDFTKHNAVHLFQKDP